MGKCPCAHPLPTALYLYSYPQTSLFDCTNKIGSIYTLREIISNPPNMVLKKYHAWGIGYYFPQCTDTPNFIFAIKQRGLGLSIEVYNYLLFTELDMQILVSV